MSTCKKKCRKKRVCELKGLNRLSPEHVDGDKPLNNVADAPSPEEVTIFPENKFGFSPEKTSPTTRFNTHNIPPFTWMRYTERWGSWNIEDALIHVAWLQPCVVSLNVGLPLDNFKLMIRTRGLDSNCQTALFPPCCSNRAAKRIWKSDAGWFVTIFDLFVEIFCAVVEALIWNHGSRTTK